MLKISYILELHCLWYIIIRLLRRSEIKLHLKLIHNNITQKNCSQEPATSTYPEPDQSSPRLILFLDVPFHIIQSSTLGSSRLDVSSGFHTETLAKNLSKSSALFNSSQAVCQSETLLASRPNPRRKGHHLLAIYDCLIRLFLATLHIWRPFLHPQPEDAQCSDDRNPLIQECTMLLHVMCKLFKPYQNNHNLCVKFYFSL